MTEKTKRIILIAAGVLLCAALVVGIVSRLAAVPMPIDPAIPDDTPNTKDPVVNISDPEVKVDSRTDGKQHDPGRDADSSGTERPPSRMHRSIPARRRRTMRRTMCRKRTATRKRRPPTSRSRLR